jgi:hypothetical protein
MIGPHHEEVVQNNTEATADEGFLTTNSEITLDWARHRFGPENVERFVRYVQGTLGAVGHPAEWEEAASISIDLIRFLVETKRES